jgi:hypothetical protein
MRSTQDWLTDRGRSTCDSRKSPPSVRTLTWLEISDLSSIRRKEKSEEMIIKFTRTSKTPKGKAAWETPIAEVFWLLPLPDGREAHVENGFFFFFFFLHFNDCPTASLRTQP